MSAELDALRRRLDDVECEVARLARENNEQCDQIFELQQQLRKADEKNVALRAELDALRGQRAA